MVKFIWCVLIFCLLITQLAVAQQEQTMEGRASYYGINFHGKKTANGEVFDMNEFTAAHPDLPF
jgi:rare lipoprotein A (peptidoglycan hydrolase)